MTPPPHTEHTNATPQLRYSLPLTQLSPSILSTRSLLNALLTVVSTFKRVLSPSTYLHLRLHSLQFAIWVRRMSTSIRVSASHSCPTSLSTYSKTSNTEREGRIQKPATQREKDVFKIKQERERETERERKRERGTLDCLCCLWCVMITMMM